MKEMSRREWRRRYRQRKKILKMELDAAKRKNKVSGRFMNRVVISMILAALIYTIVTMIVFVRTGAEPSTLTDNVFRYLSIEGGAMALIKSVKTVTKSKAKNIESTVEPQENEPEQHEEE